MVLFPGTQRGAQTNIYRQGDLWPYWRYNTFCHSLRLFWAIRSLWKHQVLILYSGTDSILISVWFCLVWGVPRFQAMWLVDAVHEGYQLVFSLVRILHLLRPGWRQNSCVQCTSVLVYTTSVKPYNWFRQTVCNPSLNENNVAGSIWHGSKNCRKGGTIIFWFQDNFLSWNCLIGATLIALGSGGTSNFRQAGAG